MYTKIFLHIIILCAVFVKIIESAKILVVVPSPSISHQVVFHSLIRGLINRGHEVVYVTTDPMFPNGNSPKNLTEINLHDLSYGLYCKVHGEIKKVKLDNPLPVMTIVFQLLSKTLGEQLKHEAIHKLINDKMVRFDLLILEECVTATLIFSHIFKAPVIQMSSFGSLPGNMERVGATTQPLLYPTHYHQKQNDLNIWEKVREVYNHVMFEQMLKNQEIEDDKMLRDILGNDIPPLKKLKNNVDMIFLNVHPIWVRNQPVPPDVISIWGIYKTPEKTLPEDLQSYLDSSKNGVIYMSFGSNINSTSIPSEKLEILLKVFSGLPYNILWKWDLDELPGKSQNIKISKWFPQSDLLRHPNLKLFITQGGLQSTDEAINAGVPLIGFPMVADQEYNTEKYEDFKIGIKLQLNNLNEETFRKAINTVINDDSYRKNIITLRTHMLDQPQSPLERAIWWTEYVLRHGGAKHLRSPAANMSWAEYYELKLVLILLSILLVFMTTILVIAYYCFKIILFYMKRNKIKTS